MMQSKKASEAVQFAKRRLEGEAKEVQEKLGGGKENSSVATGLVVVPSDIGKRTGERIKFLETENVKLKARLKDCEEAVDMANNETDKSKKVAHDAKAKIVDFQQRVDKLGIEVQEAGAKTASLEISLKNAEERFLSTESIRKGLQSKLQNALQAKHSIEGDLRGADSRIRERETKLADMSKEIADKDEIIKDKEALVGELSQKADHFQSRAIPAEEKASRFQGSVGQYAEELRNAVARANRLAAALRAEEVKSTGLENEVNCLRKHAAEDSAHAKVLAARVAELDSLVSAAKDEALKMKMNLEGDVKSLEDVAQWEAERKQAAESTAKKVNNEKTELLSTIEDLTKKFMGAFSKAEGEEDTAKAKAEEAEMVKEKNEERECLIASEKEKLREYRQTHKALSTELEAAKAKAKVGESVAEVLQEKEVEVGKLGEDLQRASEGIVGLGIELNNALLERDEALESAAEKDRRVKELEVKIEQLQNELQCLSERDGELEEQLKHVGVEVEKHKGAIRGHETTVRKAQEAAELQEQVRSTEENIRGEEENFESSVQTSYQEGKV